MFDLMFNTSLGVLATLVAGGVWLLVGWSGLLAIGNGATSVLMEAAETLAERAAPSLPLYLTAAASWRRRSPSGGGPSETQ